MCDRFPTLATPHLLFRQLLFFSLFIIQPALAQAQLPAVPVPVENPITEAKRVLGKILFWDEQLSSDNTVACGTCHAPMAAGGDLRLGTHPGADAIFGTIDDVIGSPGVVRRDSDGFAIEDPLFGFDVQVTGRAAPNFFGGIWSPQQFWDGRAEGQLIDPLDGVTVAISANGSLEVQALGPILSDVEMAAEGRTWAEVTSKLAAAVPMIYATAIPTDMQSAIAASPIFRACAIRSAPAGVSSSPRPKRSNNTTPSSVCNASTCRLSVGCANPNARAAADSDPSSAVTRKARTRFQSKVTEDQSMHFCISEIEYTSIMLR